MSKIMVRLEAALLIVLAMNLATIPAVAAHAPPHTGGLHERIVMPSDRGPLQQPYIRMSEGARLATEPTHADAPSGQAQLTGAYYSALMPLLIACGALLAMVSLRNSDIATRSRVAVDALEKAADEHRVTSLKRQIAWFNYRYLLCSISFICLALASGLFALSSLRLYQDVSPLDLWIKTAWGMGFLMGGLGLLCLEFLLGPITVISNSRSVRK